MSASLLPLSGSFASRHIFRRVCGCRRSRSISGSPRRGRAARASSPVAQCVKCGDGICDKHLIWVDGEPVCTKCAKAAGVKAPPR